ncbi:hypothetical protein ABTG52_11655, partial [Acinetobacter baumannii]
HKPIYTSPQPPKKIKSFHYFPRKKIVGLAQISIFCIISPLFGCLKKKKKRVLDPRTGDIIFFLGLDVKKFES